MRLFEPHEYQPRLSARFEALRAPLVLLLPYAQVEHIGASSIEDAVSKGDLDIAVMVDGTRFAEAFSALQRHGYREKRDTLQTAQLRMLLPDGQPDDHALQLVEADSPYDFFVTFRDALRADAALLAAYNDLKRRATRQDDASYRRAKDAFIESVLKRRP